jgi:transcriptional regulator with GAF, ATPase, and Fis domain/predicted negative regulator of RcsB-dependent stress response
MLESTMGDVKPQRVGGYLLHERYTQGPTGSVFLARDVGGRRVVFKRHEPGEGEAGGLAEASLLGISHPGIAACLDVGRVLGEGRLYTVTEFVAGRPLGPDALGNGAIDAGAAVRLCARLLSALACVHEHGVLHRDLKDDNVLLESGSGRPVLIDFGLCCAISGAAEQPLSGTPRAMAPELFGGGSASVASDLWAAGLLLAEALLGRRLFAATDAHEMAVERASFAGLDERDVARIGEPALAALLGRLLLADPAARPDDARSALAALPALDEEDAAALHDEALSARRSAALAASDPRRAARLRAARQGSVWVAGLDTPGGSLSEAALDISQLAAGLAEPDPRLAARLGDLAARQSVRPVDLAGLIEALAAHGALTFGIGVARADNDQLADLRGSIARMLDGVDGVAVFDEPRVDAEACVTALRAWLGECELLEQRLCDAAPMLNEDLADALAELQRARVVRLGAEGLVLDEGRLHASWPLGTESAFPEGLDEPQREALSLLGSCPHPLSGEALGTALGIAADPVLASLVDAGLLRRQRNDPHDLYAPADGRLRRRFASGPGAPAEARTRLALGLLDPAQPLDEHRAAALASVLGEEAPAAHDDPALGQGLVEAAEVLRRAGRLAPAVTLQRRGLAGAGAASPLLTRMHLDLVDTLTRAGEHEQALAALATARSQIPDEAALDVREARVLFLRGRHDDALEVLRQFDPESLPRDDALLGLQVRAQALAARGRLEDALLDVRAALRLQGQETDRRTMALLERAGTLEEKLGHYDEAVRHYEACIDLARSLGHELLIGSPLYNMGRAIRARGEKRRGLALQEEGVLMLEAAGDLVNLGVTLNGLGAGWLTQGRVDTARRHLARAQDIARRLDNRSLAAMVLNNTGRALAAEGRLDEAEAAWESSLEMRAEQGDRRGQAAVVLTRGAVRLGRGMADPAASDLSAARELLEGVEATDWQVEADLLQARLALARGSGEDELSEAADAARRALGVAEDAALGREQLVAQDLLARAGQADLAALDPEQLERGAWLSDLLFTRAAGRELAGLHEAADADYALAFSMLGETPDGPVEARGLLLRLEGDLTRVDAALSAPSPDYGKVGVFLSRISRDIDRARVLVDVHDLKPLHDQLDETRRRLDAAGGDEDVKGLTALSGRLRILERLAELNKALNSERDGQRLLDLIVDSAIEITGAARGFLILFDGRAEQFRAARNIDESTIHRPEFEVSHSVARRVVHEGKPILTANAIDDPRLQSAASISALNLLSIVCVPLISRGRTLGAIYLDHPQVVGRFDETHLDTVTALAEQAAIALENARLSEGLESSNQELRGSREEIARLNEALEDRLVKREAELEQVRESLDASRRALELRYDYSRIITRSPRMHEVLDLMDRITDTDFPVIIRGESGTGKELIAHAIHFNGSRKQENFLSLNCAAIAEPLIESELFGSVRGAFTGADRDRKGLFEQANGGTLLLDEIGDMSLGMQKRLLRVLQEGEFLPVGGREQRSVDVRILAATHRDLTQMVAEQSFREDLYYRLAVAQIQLPPLRERTEDIALLLPHFLERHGGSARPIDPEALAILSARPWPGNVRELENFAMNLLLFDREGERVSAPLVRRLLAGAGEGVPDISEADAPTDGGSLTDRVQAFERNQLLEALQTAGGNKTAAARALGIGVRTLYKKLERVGL